MTLKNNTLWNLIGSGSPMLIGIIAIPYLIGKLGVESFGIITLIWALIGYFSLFDLGLGRALTQQVAANRTTEFLGKLDSIVKTGLLLTCVTGIAGGLLLAASAYQLGFKWLNVSSTLQQTTFDCLLISALGIPLTTLTSGLKGILEAYEDFKLVSLLRIVLGLANFGLPVLSVMIFGPKLTMIVISLVLARFIVLVAHWILVSKKIPYFWLAEMSDKKSIKSLLSFGAWMTLSNIISPLMVTADRFIISSILGAGLVAYYTVPFEMLIRVLIIPASLTTALFPRLTSLTATNIKASKDLYQKSLKLITLVMFAICFLLAVGSYLGIKLWLGQDFATHTWHIASILALGILFNSIAQIPHAAIQASGNVKVTALIHLSELILYVPFLVFFLKYFGLTGAAVIWVLRVFCDMSVLLYIANKNYVK